MTRLWATLLSLLVLAISGSGLAQQADAEAAASAAAETRRVFEAYAKDHDTSYYAENATFIDMTQPAQVIVGREAITAFIGAFYGGAFGDGRYELQNMVIEGNFVMQESIFYGTHTGQLGDIPATGKTVEFPFMSVYQIENGEIVWAHLYYDSATLLRQLGVIE